MKNEEYKKLSIAEFTKAAGRYESNHAGIYEMCKKDYPDILAELEKEPFRELLDAGCGPAPMISLLSEKYPDRHYTGLDLTPAMIEQAKKKDIPNATFVVGDCENFPFENESFDAIICSMSFHHYPDPQAFFDSVKRCLRPNGRLILRDPVLRLGIVLKGTARFFRHQRKNVKNGKNTVLEEYGISPLLVSHTKSEANNLKEHSFFFG